VPRISSAATLVVAASCQLKGGSARLLPAVTRALSGRLLGRPDSAQLRLSTLAASSIMEHQQTTQEAGCGTPGQQTPGAPLPPPSPLSGCYLLIVIGEPHSQEHKEIILQRIAKGRSESRQLLLK
jgi:hypothetical protein